MLWTPKLANPYEKCFKTILALFFDDVSKSKKLWKSDCRNTI